MSLGRKYKLNVNYCISHGIYTSGGTSVYDLTNAFNIVCEDDNLHYNDINVVELAALSENEYSKRLNDFLLSVGVLSQEMDNLKNDAIINTPDCVNCLINSNFTVEEYDTGVRVINYGVGYYTLQFNIVNVGETPNDNDWQVNDIFTNMNMNLTYDVYVRDYDTNNDVVMCVKMNRIDFSQFNQVVTKTVSFNNDVNILDDKFGHLVVDPPLENDEKITFNLELGIDTYDNTTGFAKLICKPFNGINNTLANITGNTVNKTILMSAGDDVCYDLQLNTPTYGDTGHTYICMLSAVGNEHVDVECNTTCIGLTKDSGSYDLTVSLSRTSETDEFGGETIYGMVDFNPSSGIPVNECIGVSTHFFRRVSGNTEISGRVYCKPDGDNTYHKIGDETDNHYTSFDMCNGDSVCYALHANVDDADSSALISLSLFSVNGITNGINPTIGTIDSDFAEY
jgi:hypothetical protein